MGVEENGELLRLASAEFDVFLTADQNLDEQRNVSHHDIAIIVLVARSNRLDDLIPLVPRLLELLPTVRSGRVHRVSR
jgi:hypothetical protein